MARLLSQTGIRNDGIIITAALIGATKCRFWAVPRNVNVGFARFLTKSKRRSIWSIWAYFVEEVLLL